MERVHKAWALYSCNPRTTTTACIIAEKRLAAALEGRWSITLLVRFAWCEIEWARVYYTSTLDWQQFCKIPRGQGIWNGLIGIKRPVSRVFRIRVVYLKYRLSLLRIILSLSLSPVILYYYRISTSTNVYILERMFIWIYIYLFFFSIFTLDRIIWSEVSLWGHRDVIK